jgi:D-lactate dehydrogenase
MSKEGILRGDLAALPARHRAWVAEVLAEIPASRVFCDPLRTYAWGTDASFYRLDPRVVVKARSVGEIAALLRASTAHGVPLTFRAAGTSLSGQAVTDSVLVVLAGAWRRHRIMDGGGRIALEPGIIGSEANRLLAAYRRKIGPDPASIDHCMIGGIAANNASGMCCGTAENSYRTVESMKLVLHDGSLLDTADPGSRRDFAAGHAALLDELSAIRDEIRGDAGLSSRIAAKFKVKNTTGYGVNAFVDYEDPIDILLHLLVGSEGTLGFIAEITYRTVEEHEHKASALVFFPDMATACRAATLLRSTPVAAVELMDRASLRSVEDKEGMPEGLADLAPATAALLVETRAGDGPALAGRIAEIEARLAGVATVGEIKFTTNKTEYERLWKVRKGLYPAVGAMRKTGTSVVIEDVVFPIARLAEAALDLEALIRAKGYAEGIIFGHALEGNLHFLFTQDFGDQAEVERYGRFMAALADLVVGKYDGSLKGEHGTGRNMAPFVELEWGARIYALMRRIKTAFDPLGLLNPGVLMGEDPRVHLEHLKALPATHDIVDPCIECGFCESSCPSQELSLTPRQRIAVAREISRLGRAGGDARLRRRLERDYLYLGERTCAVDGLCATDCPVSIDTGKYIKERRRLSRSSLASGLAAFIADHFAATAAGLRLGLVFLTGLRGILGEGFILGASRALRALTGGRAPLWNRAMPAGAARLLPDKKSAAGGRKVVYFPSCIARSMGASAGDSDSRSLHEAMLSLLAKGGYEAVFPEGLAGLCCGMAFGSKGFVEEAGRKRSELETALLAASRDGEYPVLFDTSPCLHFFRTGADGRLRLYEPVEFIGKFLLGSLEIDKLPETIALHITCSSRKMGLSRAFVEVAGALAERVVVPPHVGCCGVAGDRIFTFPELSASALSRLREDLPTDCRSGYSNSRTCEIGLSLESGIPYQSLVYLADRRSRPKG